MEKFSTEIERAGGSFLKLFPITTKIHTAVYIGNVFFKQVPCPNRAHHSIMGERHEPQPMGKALCWNKQGPLVCPAKDKNTTTLKSASAVRWEAQTRGKEESRDERDKRNQCNNIVLFQLGMKSMGLGQRHPLERKILRSTWMEDEMEE